MATKIICIVDNEVKTGSGLINEHGLSFWIETANGVVLFDTGQTRETLAHNLEVLGRSPLIVKKLAFSHAHNDHTGGMEAILGRTADLMIHAHPDIFRPRFSMRNGEYRPCGVAVNRADLARRAHLELSTEPLEILPDLWTTGEIVERSEPEGRSNTHFIKLGEGWQPDPYRDDMSLVLKTGDSLVVICGCCHAGILNTLFQVKRVFKRPIRTVMGGIHLVHADGPYLDHVIEVINENFPDAFFHLNHCTGRDAIERFSAAFPGRVSTFPAGSELRFDG